MKTVRLYCLPYAGGLAGSYLKWNPYLADFIELVPIELAGRGRRREESAYGSFRAAIRDLYAQIRSSMDAKPYAIYGHSMGALMAYELGLTLERSPLPNPEHIFFSGHKPPHLTNGSKNLHRLGDDEFKKAIMAIGGTPSEVFQDRELVEFFLPILRADYRMIETHVHEAPLERLDCDISVFFGIQDRLMQPEDAHAWRSYTQEACQLYEFDGGHFFIHHQIQPVVEKINQILLQPDHLPPRQSVPWQYMT